MRSLVAFLMYLAFVFPTRSDEKSTISIALSVKMSAISEAANRMVPNRIVEQTHSQTCVEPQKVCTKIPEFRGFKVYSRMECIEVTPRIDCSIDQVVDRAGPLTIGGDGDTFTIRETFDGRATVRGRGEIGRHIQETATGSVVLTVSLSPRIRSDWGIEADIRHSIEWTKPPTAQLFNIFPVTFQTEATQALNREIEAFKANGLRREFDKIDLKGMVAPLWAELQSPVAVKMPDGRELSLFFRPSAVALSPFGIEGDGVSTRLSVEGRLLLTDESTTDAEPAALPELSAVPPSPGLSLTLPVEINLSTLTDIVSAELPVQLELEEPVSGMIEVRSLAISEADDHSLVVTLETLVTTTGIGPVALPLTLEGNLAWDAQSETLALEEPMLRFDGGGPAESFFNALASTPAALAKIAERVRIPLGKEIDALETELSRALDRMLTDSVRAEGAVEIAVADLRLDGGLRLTMKANGTLSVEVFELK